MDIFDGHLVIPLFLLQFAFQFSDLQLEFAVEIFHDFDLLRILRLCVVL